MHDRWRAPRAPGLRADRPLRTNSREQEDASSHARSSCSPAHEDRERIARTSGGSRHYRGAGPSESPRAIAPRQRNMNEHVEPLMRHCLEVIVDQLHDIRGRIDTLQPRTSHSRLAQAERKQSSVGDYSRHRPDHCTRLGSDSDQPFSIFVRATIRGMARPSAAAKSQRWATRKYDSC